MTHFYVLVKTTSGRTHTSDKQPLIDYFKYSDLWLTNIHNLKYLLVRTLNGDVSIKGSEIESIQLIKINESDT